MSLDIANGQVAASATALSTATSTDLWTVVLRNTSGSTTETVELTVLVNGGTARKYPRVVLPPNCSGIHRNIPVESGDIVKASSTNAATVDYVVTGVGPVGNAVLPNFPPYQLMTFDANGAQNTAAGTTSSATLTATTALIAKKIEMSPQPTDTYSATMTIDVSYSYHIVQAVNGTSATCTMTPSGAGTAGDILVIVTETDGSGTVTVTFASTFHSSGTQASTASKRSSIMFVSDGTQWIEVCRTTALS